MEPLISQPRLIVRVFFLALIAACAGPTRTVLAQQPPGLFIAAGPPAAADARLPARAVRMRHVTVDAPRLVRAAADDAAAVRVTLNLFPDLSFVAERDRVDVMRTGTVWVGHVPGIPFSAVSLSFVNGSLHGSVLTPAATYIVRPDGPGGVHAVMEVDQSAFPAGADPLEPTSVDTAAAAMDAPSTASDDDGTVIDVMVLYTPAAEAAAGGTSPMQALINASISTTNTTYVNSGITQRLRLVYAGPVAYTETGGSTGISQDLRNLTSGTGSLSGVAALRDAYHADLVSLFTDTPGTIYCGIAWMMNSVDASFADYGYNVVEQICAVGTLTYPHELGHNMGARHDWFVDQGVTPHTYSHGYVNTTTRVRTVMSYDTLCGSQGFGCMRIPYWANPNLTYNGGPIGVAAGTDSSSTCYANPSNPPCDADDHRTLNESAYTVANFRRSPLTVRAFTASVNTAIPAGTAVTWTADATGGAAPYSYKFWIYDGTTWTVGQDWSPANAFVWTPAVPGSYTLQVWARNAGSVATYDAWRGAAASVVAAAPLSVATVDVSPLTARAGTPVMWTTAASGGTPPYTYKFHLFDGTTWSVGQDWSSSDTWSWTPMAAGTYSVQVWARNAGSASAYDAWRSSGGYLVSPPLPLGLRNLMSTPSFPAVINTPVSLTATATGGLPPQTYKVYVYNGSAWSLVQDWTTSNVWSWTPTAPGNYTFQVWVRNAGSTAMYDTWRSFGPYQVTGPLPLSLTGLQSDRTFPVPAGTPIAWIASASNGTPPYTFKFYVHDGTTWNIGQDWSGSNGFDWVPSGAGTYSVQVWARNAGSTSTYDTWLGASDITIGPPAPLTVTSLSVGQPNLSLTAGAQLDVRATATGGLGPYEYKFYIYDGQAWSVALNWGPTNAFTWTPTTAGTYSIQVWVRNAGSTSTWDAWKAAGPLTVVP